MTSTPTRVTESSPREFQALDLAFLGSLLPGIIHNWSTPLSGVIGATQLLEKRVSVIHELLSHYETLSSAERDELNRQLERNKTNVEILSRNAQHLADLLQVLVYRITRGNGSARDCFPLHELVQNELRFLEANLQFKHKVRKAIKLDPAFPASAFSYGYVAAIIDELVTSTIAAHDFASGLMEMDIETQAVNGWCRIKLVARHQSPSTSEDTLDPLVMYLKRLEDDGWKHEYQRRSNEVSLMLYRPERNSA